MAALRPFASVAELIDAADRIWGALGNADRLEAIVAHARPHGFELATTAENEIAAAAAEVAQITRDALRQLVA